MALFLLFVALSLRLVLANPMGSSFSAESCAILKAFRWSRLHQQVCHFSQTLTLFLLRLTVFHPFSMSHSLAYWQEQMTWPVKQRATPGGAAPAFSLLVFAFLGLKGYGLVKILRRTCLPSICRGTCTSSSFLLGRLCSGFFLNALRTINGSHLPVKNVAFTNSFY